MKLQLGASWNEIAAGATKGDFASNFQAVSIQLNRRAQRKQRHEYEGKPGFEPGVAAYRIVTRGLCSGGSQPAQEIFVSCSSCSMLNVTASRSRKNSRQLAVSSQVLSRRSKLLRVGMNHR